MNNPTKLSCLFFIVIIAGCAKDKTQQIKEQSAETAKHTFAPGLTFSPASGLNLSAVTITGNFSTTPGANVVKFNGVTGIINSVAADKIVVTVPATAATGKVSVTTNSITTTSSTDFKVLHMVKQGVYKYIFNLTYCSFDRLGRGTMYVSDKEKVHKITSDGKTALLYAAPHTEGKGNHYEITGIDNDKQGNVYISEAVFYLNIDGAGVEWERRAISSSIIKIAPDKTITRINTDGAVIKAFMLNLKDNSLAFKNYGFDANAKSVWKLTSSGKTITTLPVPGNTYPGVTDFKTDKYDNYYFFDNSQLKKVNLNGTINTIAGQYKVYSNINGAADKATFYGTSSYDVDSAQNVFIVHGNVDSSTDLRLVNTAGYTSSIKVPSPEKLRSIFIDPYTGNMYFLTKEVEDNVFTYPTVTKYAIK